MSEVELVLVNGGRRRLVLARPSDSIAHALDRLDDWIETENGGWVQKQHIVEVRLIAGAESSPGRRPASSR